MITTQKKPSAFEAITNIVRAREQKQKHDATIARNVAKGRCPVCRKKPFDCHCPKSEQATAP